MPRTCQKIGPLSCRPTTEPNGPTLAWNPPSPSCFNGLGERNVARCPPRPRAWVDRVERRCVRGTEACPGRLSTSPSEKAPPMTDAAKPHMPPLKLRRTPFIPKSASGPSHQKTFGRVRKTISDFFRRPALDDCADVWSHSYEARQEDRHGRVRTRPATSRQEQFCPRGVLYAASDKSVGRFRL
jgi:hypothetical protein